jgi:hypothetical protein
VEGSGAIWRAARVSGIIESIGSSGVSLDLLCGGAMAVRRVSTACRSLFALTRAAVRRNHPGARGGAGKGTDQRVTGRFPMKRVLSLTIVCLCGPVIALMARDGDKDKVDPAPAGVGRVSRGSTSR